MMTRPTHRISVALRSKPASCDDLPVTSGNVPSMADLVTEIPSTAERPVVLNHERLYEYRFRDVDQAARQEVWREIASYVHGRMGAPQCVLDPAAGRGEFITAVPAAERWGIDLVKQGDIAAAGVRMIIADIMDAELPQDYFDGVFLSNFLEHLPSQDAVAAVLGKLRDAMAPGGRIAIIGPNFR